VIAFLGWRESQNKLKNTIMKKQTILLIAAILLMLPSISSASSGLIISTNGSIVFTNFSAPAGEYITELDGYWSAGSGYVLARTSGGSSGIIMTTHDVQIYFNNVIAPAGSHITTIGPAGSQYLHIWSDTGSQGDLIFNGGGSSIWTFTNFTAPSGEVVTGFTSSSSGGFVNLTAQSSSLLSTVDNTANLVSIAIFPNPSNGVFTIQMENVKSQSADRKIEIYNVPGEKIYSAKVKQSTSDRIDLSNSSKGVYFVKLIEGTEVYIRRVVVE
jgi:hypothetical protein